MSQFITAPLSLIWRLLPVLLMALLPSTGWADTLDIAGVKIDIGAEGGNEDVGAAFQILALLTVLSLAPAILMVLTAFTRIIIVLAMLRMAFGMPSTPPNTVLVSLALFLTIFTMMPVIEQINQEAVQPFSAGEMTSIEAATQGLIPLRTFMIKQTREKDMALVIELSGKDQPKTIDDIATTSLIPAFILSELQTAFQIGFVIFLPFLLIDLLAASVLMAMGMIMVPPLTISLPIKVLMFVLIDGWILVTRALVGSFM
jgi:flagellar biosynthetic protein FliP